MNNSALVVMSMPGGLRIDADGVWRHAEVPVENLKIAEYFSRHLRYDPDLASFVVAVDGRCVLVEVEDAPFILRALDLNQDPPRGLLSDGLCEDIDLSSLTISDSHSMYVKRYSTGLWCKFSRSATQTLLPFVNQDADSRFFVELSGKMHYFSER